MSWAEGTTTTRPAADYDVEAIRPHFPILSREVYPGVPLTYLDNAASAQKPRVVIEAITQTLEYEYSNVHRGVHYLSQQITNAYENARQSVADFLGAPKAEQIVFTRSATEAINLVAYSYARKVLQPGDEIVLSVMEHHANIVPWQLVARERGAQLKVVRCDKQGALDLQSYSDMLSERTRLVAMSHCSNVLGTINPVHTIIQLAHNRGLPVLLDGAQGAVHLAVDVKELDVDFYAITGHKLYGPTAIGALYAKSEHLLTMPPFMGGGDMVAEVTFERTRFCEPPHRFEAGTPAIVEAIGLARALEYLSDLGMEAISNHETSLLEYASSRLSQIDGLHIIGTATPKAAILSFTIDGVHSHDIAAVLDQFGVAVRAGHHCAMPLAEHLGIVSTTRASFGLYNTRTEVDRLVEAVQQVKRIF